MSEKFRHYLIGKLFILKTDNRVLTYLQSTHTSKSRKLLNCALKLSEFDFKIVHISSKNNGISDCLSRLHENINTIFEIEPVLSCSEILDSQMKDECMKHAISYLHSKSNSDIDKLGSLKRYRKHLNTDKFGLLCWRSKMVIPKNLRSYILQVA